MNKRLLSHGKLSRLPRVKSSYRKIKPLLTQVFTWVLMLIFVTSQASAVYTPTSAAELIARSKPVSQIKIQTNPAPVQENKPAEAEVSSPETNTLSEVADRPTPEIVIEIKSAEYIPPPPPKPPVRAVVVIPQPVGNNFPFGFCTWGVANLRPVPWSGNAREWLDNARAMGYATGNTPRVGSIMSSIETSPLGHVALVTSVGEDGSFTVKEMNSLYNGGGWGKYNIRTIYPGTIRILGFIY